MAVTFRNIDVTPDDPVEEFGEIADTLVEVFETAEDSGVVGALRCAFARRIGTSRTRLNTYLTGRTTPSAAVLVRSERVAGKPSHRPA